MEFSEPSENAGPEFDQTSYRVQIFPDSWPQPGYPFAVISSHSSPVSNVTYSLFTPDNEKSFAVDPNTGELFLTSSVPPGDEFCTLLVAKNAEGQQSAVPVAINTGGPRRDCINFDTTYLSPSVYHGPHRGSVGQWTTIGPTTSTETEGPGTFTDPPANTPETPTTAIRRTTPSTAGGGSEGLPTRPPVFPPGSQVGTSTAITEEPSSSTFIETSETEPTATSMGIVESTTEEVSKETIAVTDTSPGIPEPTQPLPVSPDASPMTVTQVGTAVTEPTEFVVTITPDSHPPELTAVPTNEESFPTPVPSVISTPSTELPEVSPTWEGTTSSDIPIMATTEEYIIVSPDSSPETFGPVTDEVTESPEPVTSTESTHTESKRTINPEEGTNEPQWPTVLPPVWTPVGGGATLATYETTPRPSKTTLDPYYGMACSKRGQPIWDLICELSKATIRKP
ncbi:hypothetical protein COOONC_25929 [Cooperia oncophora]